MQSKHLIANLENKGFTSMEQLREVVDPIRHWQQYQSMMVKMDEFMNENPHFAKEPGAIMDIMDSFYKLILLPLRVGPMCFNRADVFQVLLYKRFCVVRMRSLDYCNHVI